MAIQDSNAERRNLVVTSAAFIAFYYGGGKLSSNAITLQVVSVTFNRPVVLAVMAWTSLLWFLYRYWLLNSGEFSRAFSSEFHAFCRKPYVEKYAEKRTAKSFALADKDSGHHMQTLVWRRGCVRAPYIYASNVTRDAKTGDIQSYSHGGLGGGSDGEVIFSDIKGWVIALRATAHCFFRKQSFSSYIVPYILFLLALMGPLVSHTF